MTNLYNKKEFTDLRQKLRNTRSPVEQKLWDRLKGRQLLGCKFRRQYGVGRKVVDFYCPELRLAIELDGESHVGKENVSKDQQRQKYIESFDITLIRIGNTDVLQNLEGVMEYIEREITSLTTPNPSL